MAEYIERRTSSNKLYDVYEYVKRNIIADGKPVDASLVENIMLRFEKALNCVPSADVAPVMPELRRAVKLLHLEYEAAKRNPIVRDPLAYALFQVWKAVDGDV